MDQMTLTVFRCTAGEATRILGPYMRDYFRRDGRFRDGTGILVISLGDSVSIRTSTISRVEGPTQKVTFATFTAMLQENLPPPGEEKLYIGFIAHTPREHVVYPGGDLTTDGFLLPDLDKPLVNGKLLQSL